jgi:hypothetical protein
MPSTRNVRGLVDNSVCPTTVTRADAGHEGPPRLGEEHIMTNRRRVSVITATAAALAAAALATTVQSNADAAPAADAHISSKTTLHLHVSGCDSCSIQLVQALPNYTPVWHSRSQTVGGDHVVTFTVATVLTHGMSFDVRAPWAKGTDAVPNAVTAYAGHQVRSTVSVEEARSAVHAAGCWAGTSKTTEDLSFAVDRVHTKSATGAEVVTPLVYASPTLSSWQPLVKTFHGTIGNQDAFYCWPTAS